MLNGGVKKGTNICGRLLGKGKYFHENGCMITGDFFEDEMSFYNKHPWSGVKNKGFCSNDLYE